MILGIVRMKVRKMMHSQMAMGVCPERKVKETARNQTLTRI
jgi:hypothetical protein